MANVNQLVVKLAADVGDYERSMASAMGKTESAGKRGADALAKVEKKAADLSKVGGSALIKLSGIAETTGDKSSLQVLQKTPATRAPKRLRKLGRMQTSWAKTQAELWSRLLTHLQKLKTVQSI